MEQRRCINSFTLSNNYLHTVEFSKNRHCRLSFVLKIDTVDFGLLKHRHCRLSFFSDWLTLKGRKLAFLAILSLRAYFKDAFSATFACSFLSVNFVDSSFEMLFSFIIRGLLLADSTVIKHPARLSVCERILLLRGTLGTARALHSLDIHNLDAAFEITESLWVFVQFATLHLRSVFWLK